MLSRAPLSRGKAIEYLAARSSTNGRPEHRANLADDGQGNTFAGGIPEGLQSGGGRPFLNPYPKRNKRKRELDRPACGFHKISREERGMRRRDLPESGKPPQTPVKFVAISIARTARKTRLRVRKKSWMDCSTSRR